MLREEYYADQTKVHRYYGQCVTNLVTATVKSRLGLKLEGLAYPFNEIPLSAWDRLTPCVSDILLRQCGSIPSLSTKVMVLKTAAHMIVSEA